MGCAVLGLACGAQRRAPCQALCIGDGRSQIKTGTLAAAGWVSYVKPPIYFGSFGALGRFAFWVALIWFGTCGKAAAPSIEFDLFNPSIPRVRRAMAGGFYDSGPREPIITH